MPYATQADLIDRFGSEELVELTDRVDGNAIDSTVVTKALIDADAILDGYLVGRYAVPVAPVPPLLLSLAADVARFKLHKDRPTEVVRKNYEDALKMLRDLSTGMAALAGAAAAPIGAAPARPEGQVRFTGGEKLLGRDRLADYLG